MKLWKALKSIPIRRITAILWTLSGFALASYGAWLIFHPAGYVTAGLLIILDTLHATRSRPAK